MLVVMKMIKKSSRQGVFYIIIATAGFSLIPVLAQMGLATDMTAATLLFYRFFIAAVIFLIYCLITRKSILLKDSREYIFVIIAGVIYSAQCILFFSSFRYISSSIGEIVYHCYPIFILILAYIFLKEPITKTKVAGVILSITGIVIVLYGPWNLLETIGIVYVVFTALISSVYMVFTKKTVSSVDTTVLTFYLCVVCSVIYFCYSMLSNEFAIIPDVSIAVNVIILAVCSTVIGFFFFMKAIILLPVGQVSILSLLEPVFTIILAFFMLRVDLTVIQILGTGIVLIGIYVYEK